MLRLFHASAVGRPLLAGTVAAQAAAPLKLPQSVLVPPAVDDGSAIFQLNPWECVSA